MGPTTGLGVRRGDYVKQEVLLRKFSQNSYQGISLACRYIYIYIEGALGPLSTTLDI